MSKNLSVCAITMGLIISVMCFFSFMKSIMYIQEYENTNIPKLSKGTMEETTGNINSFTNPYELSEKVDEGDTPMFKLDAVYENQPN